LAEALKDGSTYHFERGEVFSHVYMHAAQCCRADYRRQPRPKHIPEVLTKLAQAKDREVAVRLLYPSEVLDGTGPFCAFDLKTLIETGELKPRIFAPSAEPITS